MVLHGSHNAFLCGSQHWTNSSHPTAWIFMGVFHLDFSSYSHDASVFVFALGNLYKTCIMFFGIWLLGICLVDIFPPNNNNSFLSVKLQMNCWIQLTSRQYDGHPVEFCGWNVQLCFTIESKENFIFNFLFFCDWPLYISNVCMFYKDTRVMFMAFNLVPFWKKSELVWLKVIQVFFYSEPGLKNFFLNLSFWCISEE